MFSRCILYAYEHMSVSIHHESLLVLALCHDTMSLVGDVRIQFLLIELAVHVHNVIYC